jgi:hypothetical protein
MSEMMGHKTVAMPMIAASVFFDSATLGRLIAPGRWLAQ